MITIYSQLQQSIANWLHRSDLTSAIPEFIAMGEAHLNRVLRCREMEATATIEPSSSVSYADLPERFLEVVSFTDDIGDELQPRDAAELAAMAYAAGPGRPAYYRITSRIDFERVADATYAYSMRYIKRLDLADDITNQVLVNHPDCYLFASLAYSAPYLKDDARLATWKAMLDDAVQAANWQAARDKTLLQTELPAYGGFDIVSG